MEPSALLLMKQLREFNRHPVEGISAGLIDESNAYAWNVSLVGPSDTFYEGSTKRFFDFSETKMFSSISGGFFKARLDFPKDYPIKPPKMVTNRRGETICSFRIFRNSSRRFGIRISRKTAMFAFRSYVRFVSLSLDYRRG